MNTKEVYQIEKFSDKVVIVFSTTYVNPISYLPKIEEDLRNNIFTGKVIFDLLLSNGYSSNRFIEVNINNSKIDRSSMKVIESYTIEKDFLDKTHEFYRSHPHLLENNFILLDEEKNLIRG
jgi:hypothetical protein